MASNRNLDDYVAVHTRVEKFKKDQPKGRIVTVLLGSDPEIVYRAEIYHESDEHPIATGHASASGGMGGRRKSAHEMCETAAVGRALAFAGYEVKSGIASRDEMETSEYRATEPEPAETDISLEYAKKAGAFLTGICKLTKEEFENFKLACEITTRPWWAIAMSAKEEGVSNNEELLQFLAGVKSNGKAEAPA